MTSPTYSRRLPVLALLAALAVPSAASAAFPGTNGPVVFDRGGTIAEAPDVTLSAGGTDYAPTVSPDGSQIAWQINRDLWVMNADGSDRHAVTTDGEFNADPAWTPDGKRLVFTSNKSGNADLWVVSTTGGTAKQLTNTDDHAESQPAVSPDGTRIAYTRTGCEISHGGGTCVYVMGADGSGQANLTPEDSMPGCENQPGYYFNGATREPSWSPNGQLIAFAGPVLCDVSSIGMDIWVMAPNGAGKTNLTRDDATNDRAPAWSPDGQQIAFVSDRGTPGSTNLFTLTTSGAVTPLTTGGRDRSPDWGPAPKQCVVPKLKGQTAAAAKGSLKAMGCRAGKVTRKAGKKGLVLKQEQVAGKRLKLNAKVAFTVGK